MFLVGTSRRTEGSNPESHRAEKGGMAGCLINVHVDTVLPSK